MTDEMLKDFIKILKKRNTIQFVIILILAIIVCGTAIGSFFAIKTISGKQDNSTVIEDSNAETLVVIPQNTENTENKKEDKAYRTLIVCGIVALFIVLLAAVWGLWCVFYKSRLPKGKK